MFHVEQFIAGRSMSAELPKAVYSSELVICGVTLKCHVLDDGQRVIEADGVEALFKAFEDGLMPTEEEAMQLARVVRLDND